VEGLCAQYRTRGGVVSALHDVSLALAPGEVLAIVGEPGAGKSTLARSILRSLRAPGRMLAGSVLFQGRNLTALREAELAVMRKRQIAFLEMDGSPALRTRPGALGLRVQRHVADVIGRMPVPELIVADDIVRELDPMQAMQVIADLARACRDSATALLWTARDFRMLAGFVDRVAVLHAGRIVEEARFDELARRAAHPYTRALLDAMPARFRPGTRLRAAAATLSRRTVSPLGCAFRERCAHAMQACLALPAMEALTVSGHAVRCHRPLVMADLSP
jgi:peptide/nickel transport system ATP-binding protein